MTLKENAYAILKGEQPDFYFDFMNSIEILPDPDLMRNAIPKDGKVHADAWGTLYQFPEDAPGAHPIVNDQNAIIKDIEKWEEQIHIPPLDNLDFSLAKAEAKKVDPDEKFTAIMMGGGLFERSHHLQGMQTALMNYLEYPDETKALLRAICDFKLKYIDMLAEELKPEVIFYHDDWGFKRSMFLPVNTWREIIKPLQKEIADRMHSHNMIYMHHADCFCEPIVTDMVEIGVDIWQGVIPENDIVAIQEKTDHKLPMIGGIDVPSIDIEGLDEEIIRAEVRRAYDTYCPGGKFFPGPPGACCYIKRNNDIMLDEADKYGKIFAQEHRI